MQPLTRRAKALSTTAAVLVIGVLGGTAVIAGSTEGEITEVEASPTIEPSPTVTPSPDLTPIPETEDHDDAGPGHVPHGNAYGWHRNHGDTDFDKPGNGPKPKAATHHDGDNDHDEDEGDDD